MIHKYSGSYYRGTSIGSKKYRQRDVNPITISSSWKGYIIGFISIGMLFAFLYFNKKENKVYRRDNVEDTVELIQKVAEYNLEHDLSKQQSTAHARNNSINHRNPYNVQQMKQEKQKALIKERKRQSQYLTQQYALDDGIAYENNDVQDEMKSTHEQFHVPPQPSTDSQEIIPIDYNKQQQTNMMYNAQFGNQKPYQNINSPFLHPEETIRPLAPQPAAYNNTLDTSNKVDMFLQNVPSNIFKQDFFTATDTYESPYLANIDKISKYGSPCSDSSNVNESGDPSIRSYNRSDFFYL